MSATDVRLRLFVALAVLGALGCEDLSDHINNPVPSTGPQAPPSSEPGVEQVAPQALSERPASSLERSETEVITFRSILENEKMTREQRIRAFQSLDPAALQKPVAGRAEARVAPSTAAQGREAGSKHDQWELSAARRRLPVVMYATAWCGVCKRAREYFRQQAIPFVEYDVDRDPRAREEYLRLNPRRSVPTIKIGDDVIVGFSAVAVEQALDSAARNRLN
jgi:glutaredoxin-like YruB-family protein